MEATQVQRAIAAATSVVAELGLGVDQAIILNNSNTLILRLQPADVVARVATVANQVAQFEIELAQQLAAGGSPAAVLEPRVAACVRA